MSTPPTPQQELDPVPSAYQPTIPESTAGLLDRGECPDLQENVGAAQERSRNLRPQRTRRLPERLREKLETNSLGNMNTDSLFKTIIIQFEHLSFCLRILEEETLSLV